MVFTSDLLKALHSKLTLSAYNSRHFFYLLLHYSKSYIAANKG